MNNDNKKTNAQKASAEAYDTFIKNFSHKNLKPPTKNSLWIEKIKKFLGIV